MPLLEQGRPAPDFAVTDHNGETVKLSDYAGTFVVLWFYPKADTPGCTLEGKGFRDRMAEIQSAGAAVLGASFDTVAENRDFAEKHDFPFVLLCDTTRDLGVKYGVVADRDATHARRVTYLINREGVVARIYDQVSPETHADDVLADLAELGAAP